MQLSPLQSRLAASAVASCVLLLLYLALFTPRFASATELPLPPPNLSDDDFALLQRMPMRDPSDPVYEPEFAAFDRSIIGRAPSGVTTLTSNVASPLNVEAGTIQYFMYTLPTLASREGASRDGPLELRSESGARTEGQGLVKRANQTVFISANTCLQPQAVDPTKTTMAPPQLTMFISTSPFNQAPNPMGDSSQQTWAEFVEGAVMYNMTTSSDVYLGIYAPNVSTVFSGTTYNFEIAASVDNWYHTYNVNADADLIWVDSDSQGAILMTHNLTDGRNEDETAKVMKTPPYVLFAQNVQDRSINGLLSSYCGLNNYAQIAATKNGKNTSMVTSTMTKRGQGKLPKQQFFFSGLNTSSTYMGILATSGNASATGKRADGVIGGGGHVFKATNFTTKSDHGNCNLIQALDFCDEVAYAVPSNPKFGNSTVLAKFYDDYAAAIYDTFANKVMKQISCDAPSAQRYSLARTCDDCTAAYKNWLCSVTIPKCADFSNPAEYLQPRAINQPFPDGKVLDEAIRSSFPATNAYLNSRNPTIDERIKPGPYKEMLPCDDICYALVQSCPASLKFSCPQPNDPTFNTSYATRKWSDANKEIQCNYQGSAHTFSAGDRTKLPWILISLVLFVMLFELL